MGKDNKTKTENNWKVKFRKVLPSQFKFWLIVDCYFQWPQFKYIQTLTIVIQNIRIKMLPQVMKDLSAFQ